LIQAFLTAFVWSVNGKLILYFVRWSWLSLICPRGTPVSGPSTKAYTKIKLQIRINHIQVMYLQHSTYLFISNTRYYLPLVTPALCIKQHLNFRMHYHIITYKVPTQVIIYGWYTCILHKTH
jgi:hypothetical protein